MTSASDAGKTLRVLQRVVFPGDDLDVVPLYVETKMDRGASELAAEMAAEELTGRKVTGGTSTASAAVGEAQSSIRFGADVPGFLVEQVGPRRSARDQRGPPGLVRHLLQRVPGQLLAPLDHGERGDAAHPPGGRVEGHPVPLHGQGHSHPVETINVESDEPGDDRAHAAAGAVHRRRLVLVRHRGRPAGDDADRGGLAGADRPRPGRAGSASASPPSAQPDDLVEKLRMLGEATEIHPLLDTVYVIDQGARRVSDHPGFEDAAKRLAGRVQVIEQGNLGGSGGFSRAMDETVQAGQSDYVLLMRRRRRDRSRGHPARRHLRRPGPQADDRRRAHVQPVRALGAARVRRGGRALQVVVGQRAEHQEPARLRPPQPAQHPVAAPPGRRRLQRLVDVPDPDPGDQGARPRDAGLHQVGRRRVRGAGPRPRLPDGVAARRGLLAGAVDGQERRAGLEGLLPPAQPDRGRAAALARAAAAAS